MSDSYARQLAVYGGGSFLRSGLSFGLLATYVRFLPPEEFGQWILLELSIFVLSVIFVLGLDVALIKEHSVLCSTEEKNSLLQSVYYFALAWICGIGTLLVGFRNVWGPWVLVGPDASHYAGSAVLIAGCEALVQIRLSWLRALRNAQRFSFMTTFQAGLVLVLSVLFMSLADVPLVGALLGRLLSAAVVFLLCIAVVPSGRPFSLSGTMVRRSLAYGLPMVPTNLCSYVLFAADRYFLKVFSTLDEVALYSFAYKLAALVEVLVIRPFAIAWATMRFDVARQEEASKTYGQVIVGFLFAVSLCGSALLLFSPEMVHIVAPPIYRRALDVLPLLVLSYVIFGLSYPVNIGMMLYDKTGNVAVATAMATGANLALNWLLIPAAGMYGAVYATVLSYSLWTVLLGYYSQRLYPINYQWRAMIQIAVTAAAAVFLANVSPAMNPWLTPLLKVALLAVFVAVGVYAMAGPQMEGVDSSRTLLQTPTRVLRYLFRGEK